MGVLSILNEVRSIAPVTSHLDPGRKWLHTLILGDPLCIVRGRGAGEQGEQLLPQRYRWVSTAPPKFRV